MITGLPPFYSRNRETMFQKIMSASLDYPPHMSEQARSLLGGIPDVRDAYFGSLDKAFEGFTFVDDSAAQHMARSL
eukprot:gene4886-6111_t